MSSYHIVEPPPLVSMLAQLLARIRRLDQQHECYVLMYNVVNSFDQFVVSNAARKYVAAWAAETSLPHVYPDCGLGFKFILYELLSQAQPRLFSIWSRRTTWPCFPTRQALRRKPRTPCHQTFRSQCCSWNRSKRRRLTSFTRRDIQISLYALGKSQQRQSIHVKTASGLSFTLR